MKRIWIGNYGDGVNIATTSSDGKVRFRNVDRRSILQERKYGIRIRHLCKLNDEYIAASTTMGVIIYDMNGECVQKVGTYNTMSTTVTNDSVILVSTLGNGLNRIIRENNEWKMVKCDIEGTADVVNSVTEDSEGNLWMLSDNVLIQYSHEDKNLVKYSTEFFNINPSFSEAAPMLTYEGDLLIGESTGYIKISCHSI